MVTARPCGLMDKASVSDTGDCKFESCQGRFTFSAKEHFVGFGTGVKEPLLGFGASV